MIVRIFLEYSSPFQGGFKLNHRGEGIVAGRVERKDSVWNVWQDIS